MPTKNIDSQERGRGLWSLLKSAFASRAGRYVAGEALDADALYERGRIAELEKRNEEAVDSYREAIAAQPGEAKFHHALGAALKRSGRNEEAAAAYRAGLALTPDDAQMRSDLGLALLGLGRVEEALGEIEQARNRAPDLAEAHHNLGIAYHQLGRLEEAIAEIGQAHQLAPDRVDIHSNLLFILNYSARYTPAEILAEHRRFGEHYVQPVASPAPDTAWPRRLRIGYMSPDFHSHVVSSFMLPILVRHDRERFDVCCYYTNRLVDEVTEAIRGIADDWVDCADLSDTELVSRIRADRIDILVDLAGHSTQQRLKAFALRPAPLQVTYLGYPNTTGLSAIDFRITDARADPPGESDRLNVEQLVRLPRSFLCYRPGPDIHDLVAPPATQAGYVTFGSFNNFQKLSDPFLGAAAQVLAAVPNSRLLLKAKSLGIASVAQRLREKFAVLGVDPSRLVLLGWEETPEEHLATYQKVDIALDSFPYNGTTTTCEAMWMGVPVVALQGDRHAGRVGASLLGTVGLPELVAQDLNGYVAIATNLASDLPKLARLRAGMRQRMRASALLDERGFVRELEECYQDMWQEKLASLAELRDAAPAALDAAQELRREGKLAEARVACEAILRKQSAHKDALALLWDLGHDLADNATVVEAIGRALAAGGESAQLHYMLGCTLQDLFRLEEAIAAYQKALALDPGHAKAANNLGSAQEYLGQFDQAADSYGRALRSDPKLANALYNQANLEKRHGRYKAAEIGLRQALALEPGHADWHCCLAESLQLQLRHDEAEASERDALAIEPESARAYFGLGNALVSLSRIDDAEAAFRRAIEINPGFVEAHINLLLTLHYRKGDDARMMYEAHLEWARRHAPDVPHPEHAGRAAAQGRRLNIGYVSPDFREHAVAWLIAPVLAAQDRSQFRTFYYSLVANPDALTQRFMKLCDEWRDVHATADEAVASLIRQDKIDILVDLAGHTGGGRPLVFARKPAPVQVTWQGYPNTTGLAQMDYRITDADADPEGEADRHHTEKLVRLASGFFCYGPPDNAPEPGEPPLLQSGQITFGSFNTLAKVTPEMIGVWSQILAELPGARLIMKAYGLGAESARRHILAQFAGNGIAADRISLFGPVASHSGHLGMYREVDIALDTFPYHGTTTTCEALWMGAPVVTLAGRTHLSRVGVSILKRVGLDAFVAATPAEYVRKAVALAQDPALLREMRAGLRARMRASSLLDGAGLARALEAAYLDMWARWCSSGSAPEACATVSAKAIAESGEPLRLHIGGLEKRAGWKILNIQPGPDVDFVGNCSDLDQFADGSVAEIYVSHVLEHVGYRSALARTLAGFHRVLKPGGRAMIGVPDFELLCRLFLDPRATRNDRFYVMRMVFGGQMDEHDFHCVGLSYEFLSHFLQRAGFSRIERVQDFGLFHDDSVHEYLDHRVSLNVVAYK